MEKKKCASTSGGVNRQLLGGRMVMASPPPYDAKVEYLQDDIGNVIDGCGIDTGIVPTGGYIAFHATSLINNEAGKYPKIFAVYGRSGYTTPYWNRLVMTGSGSTTAAPFYLGHSHKYPSTDARGQINFYGKDFIVPRTRYDVDGASNTLRVFRDMKCRCYYFKIWDDDGVLIRDFIPVRKGTEGFMYDMSEKKMYRNIANGSFTLGPDI